MAAKNNNYLKPHEVFTKSANWYHESGFHRSNYKPKGKRRWYNDIHISVILVLPCILAVGLYWNSLTGDFVHDDIMAIKDNADVTGMRPLSDIMRNDFWGKRMSDNTSHKSYRPLCVLTFRINYWLAGGAYPYTFHVFNVVLHALVCVLFTYTCWKIAGLGSFVTLSSGCLFAAHPIHTEAVSGLVGRADLLAASLFLSSLLAFDRCVERRYCSLFSRTRSSGWLVISILLGVLSMLSKEHGITVLGVLIVYDVFIVCRRGTMQVLKEGELNLFCLPLFRRASLILVVLFLSVTFRIWLLNGQMPAFTDQDNPASFSPYILTRVLSYCYLLAFNAWLLVSPCTLSYDWQMGSIALVESLTDVRNLATFLLVVALLVLVALIVHGLKVSVVCPPLVIGLVTMVLAFLPASNLLFRVGFVVAERVLYIPSMGYILLVVYGLDKLLVQYTSTRKIVLFSVIVLLSVFCVRTVIRNQVWQSREVLFLSGVLTLPHNAKVHYNYANYLKDVGKTKEAIKHYRQSLRLYPNHSSANNNLGTLLSNTAESEMLYRRAISITPSHTGAHFNLGNLLHQQGKTHEAKSFLAKALEINPQYTDAYNSLASILAIEGHTREAEQLYLTAMKKGTATADLYNNYGAFLQRQGNMHGALKYYAKAYFEERTHVTALLNTAKLLRSMNVQDGVEDLFQRALDIQPDISTADSLAVFYYKTNRLSQAISLYQKYIDKLETSADAMTHYAQMLADDGKLEQAKNLLTKVVAKNSNHYKALRRLCGLFGEQGKHIQAISLITSHLDARRSGVNPAAVLSIKQKASLYHDLANHYKDISQLQQAAESYKMAAKLDPKDSQALANLGAIYHLLDDFAQANFYYTEALKCSPSDKVLKENIEKLKRRELQLNKPT